MRNIILCISVFTLFSCSQSQSGKQSNTMDCEIVHTLLSNEQIPILANFKELYEMDSLERFLAINYAYDTFTHSYLARIPINLATGKIENSPSAMAVDVRFHTATLYPEYAKEMTPTPFNIFTNNTKTRLGTEFISPDSLGFWLHTYYLLPDSSMQLNNMYSGMSLSWDKKMKFSRFEETLSTLVSSFLKTMDSHSIYRFETPLCAVKKPNYIDYITKKYFFVLNLELDLCI